MVKEGVREQTNGRRRNLTLVVYLALSGLTVIGLVYRFVQLAGSFWYDEFVTSHIIRLPWTEFWQFFRIENHTPIYFLLLRWWTSILGHSELTLRLFSAVSGVATVFVVAWGTWKCWGRLAGTVALSLASASSLLIFYSREARMYSLESLAAAVSIFVFWLWLQRPTKIRLVVYVLATLTAVAAHYSAVLVPIVQIVFFLIDRRAHKIEHRKAIVIVGVFAVAAIPWFIYNIIPRVIHPLGFSTWYNTLSPDRWEILSVPVFYALFDVMPFPTFNRFDQTAFLLLRPVVRIVLLTATISVAMYFGRRWKSNPLDVRSRFVLYCFLLTVIPLAIGFLTNINVVKFFLPGALTFLVLCAIGITELAKRSLAASATALVTLLTMSMTFIPVMVRSQAYPWREVDRYIEEKALEMDAVLIHPWVDTLSFNEDFQGATPVYGVFPLRDPVPGNADLLTHARFNAASVVTNDTLGPWMERAVQPYGRIWFIESNKDPFFRGNLVRAWLLDHEWVIGAEPKVPYAKGTFLTLFERRSDIL